MRAAAGIHHVLHNSVAVLMHLSHAFCLLLLLPVLLPLLQPLVRPAAAAAVAGTCAA
jgi:hypothetical protein